MLPASMMARIRVFSAILPPYTASINYVNSLNFTSGHDLGMGSFFCREANSTVILRHTNCSQQYLVVLVNNFIRIALCTYLAIKIMYKWTKLG